MVKEMEDMVVEGKREKDEAYIYYIPDGTWNQHFSSILLSADVFATSVEVNDANTDAPTSRRFIYISVHSIFSDIPTNRTTSQLIHTGLLNVVAQMAFNY